MTILAPTNDAFTSLSADELRDLLANPSEIDDVLRRHVIDEALTFDELSARETVTVLSGDTLTVETTGSTVTVDGAVVTPPADDAVSGRGRAKRSWCSASIRSSSRHDRRDARRPGGARGDDRRDRGGERHQDVRRPGRARRHRPHRAGRVDRRAHRPERMRQVDARARAHRHHSADRRTGERVRTRPVLDDGDAAGPLRLHAPDARAVPEPHALGQPELHGVGVRHPIAPPAARTSWSCSSWSTSPAIVTSGSPTRRGACNGASPLAATLVHEPELLFLDEPTAGVDPILRERFWAHFRALRDAGKTIVVPTQYVGEAVSCDVVAVMAAWTAADGAATRGTEAGGLRRRPARGDVAARLAGRNRDRPPRSARVRAVRPAHG